MSNDTSTSSQSIYHRIARSDHPVARLLKRAYHARDVATLPVPRFVGKIMMWVMVVVRGVYYFLARSLVCEPIFKAYCRKCGKNVHTGSFIHWIQGRGDLIVGDNVWINGKCSFTFGHRYAERPTIEIGDNTGIGHQCSFTAGKRITIGRNCMLSGQATIFDTNAHTVDAAARRAGKAPKPEDVREVRIGDHVWIGMQCMIFPGVRIGEGAVVSGGSVVRNHVPPYSVVAGNPARVMFRLKRPDEGALESGEEKSWC